MKLLRSLQTSRLKHIQLIILLFSSLFKEKGLHAILHDHLVESNKLMVLILSKLNDFLNLGTFIEGKKKVKYRDSLLKNWSYVRMKAVDQFIITMVILSEQSIVKVSDCPKQ